MNKCFITYIRCDVKTMCYIVFISHSLQWRYIKIALRKYVIKESKLAQINFDVISTEKLCIICLHSMYAVLEKVHASC